MVWNAFDDVQTTKQDMHCTTKLLENAIKLPLEKHQHQIKPRGQNSILPKSTLRPCKSPGVANKPPLSASKTSKIWTAGPSIESSFLDLLKKPKKKYKIIPKRPLRKRKNKNHQKSKTRFLMLRAMAIFCMICFDWSTRSWAQDANGGVAWGGLVSQKQSRVFWDGLREPFWDVFPCFPRFSYRT